MRELFLRLCQAVHARGLPWRALAQGETVGFGESGTRAFKVALHSYPKTKKVFEPPSILIHPPRPLADLGVPNPYPELRSSWVAQFSAQGWTVPSERAIPDVAAAVDLAIAHGR
jgi:hypothetical protein